MAVKVPRFDPAGLLPGDQLAWDGTQLIRAPRQELPDGILTMNMRDREDAGSSNLALTASGVLRLAYGLRVFAGRPVTKLWAFPGAVIGAGITSLGMALVDRAGAVKAVSADSTALTASTAKSWDIARTGAGAAIASYAPATGFEDLYAGVFAVYSTAPQFCGTGVGTAPAEMAPRVAGNATPPGGGTWANLAAIGATVDLPTVALTKLLHMAG